MSIQVRFEILFWNSFNSLLQRSSLLRYLVRNYCHTPEKLPLQFGILGLAACTSLLTGILLVKIIQ